MPRLRVKDIIIEWLKMRINEEVQTHEIEISIPQFAIAVYGIATTPGTVGRKFRELREERSDLAMHALQLVDISDHYPHREQNTWKIALSN